MTIVVGSGSDIAVKKRVAAYLVVTLVMVILAYMPPVPRTGPLSLAASPSRVLEVTLVLLSASMSLLLVEYIVIRRRLDIRPLYFVLAFGLWAAFTTFLSDFSELFVIGIAKAIELTILCASATVAGLVLASWFEESEAATLCALSIVISVLILSVVNVIETHAFISLSSEYNGVIVLSKEADGLYVARPRLLLAGNHPLLTASLLSLGIIFAMLSRWALLVKVVVLGAMCTLFVLCDARGSEIGLLASVLFLVAARRPRLILCAVSAIVISTTVYASVNFDGLAVSLLGTDALTLDGRIDLWKFALSVFWKHPLMGVGYYATRIYLLPAFPWSGQTHNSAIEVLLGTGIPGGIIFIWFTCCWLREAIRLSNRILVGVTPLLFIEASEGTWEFNTSFEMFFIVLFLVYAKNSGRMSARRQGSRNQAANHRSAIGSVAPGRASRPRAL
jgi:O-antigen ligase